MQRDKTTRQAHRKKAARLTLEGWTQDEIAVELGISQKTVSYDLKAIRKQWAKDAQQDFLALRAEKLAELLHLKKTYYEAWYRSLDESERTTQYVDVDKNGDPIPSRAVVQKEVQVGNLAALAGAERIWEKGVKLFGLDAPELMQLVTEDFDQAAWHENREKRLAAAMLTLDDAEGLEYAEDAKSEG